MVTRYTLDGPGLVSRWGWKFSALFHTSPGAHPASYTSPTSFRERKRQRRSLDHPFTFSAEVEERVGLHDYSILSHQVVF